ncbi:MAG TPA: hypothetical protein PKI03_11830 [Pseudomonadota bacterium]|nr:hypothetical protein [Pseudomonadota bacterium]
MLPGRSQPARWALSILSLGLAFSVGVASGRVVRKRPKGMQESKFFRVDMDSHKAVAASDRVAAALRLDFTSVTVDQPQYWPNEKVYLRLLSLGRPGAEWTAKVQKRDSQAKDHKGVLDKNGVAVIEIMDGDKAPLELGEYRADVQIQGGKAKGTATFAVVQGSLGSVSFAHEFRKLTKPDELESLPAGWFLGNAAGAGLRWGNGLNFKNELRVSNRAYSGEVEVHSRCMLPGCNGTYAGPSQTLKAEGGKLAGTLNVGGHSGPFQIEVVTPRGSLRHQFEGSSHVEREMLAISGNVSTVHRVSVAPYENTVQVPGRDLFVESKKGGSDPFSVDSVLPSDGKLHLTVNALIKSPILFAHQPKSDGSFESRRIPLPAELPARKQLEVELLPPWTLVTIGGFINDEFKEGWAVGMMPTGLKLAIEAPTEGRPFATLPLSIRARDLADKPAQVSAVIEVYDNRVPARAPATPLASALGDSLRNASRSVSSWTDNTGMIEEYIEDPPPKPVRPAPPMTMRRGKSGAKKELDSLLGDDSSGPPAKASASFGIGGLGLVGRGSGGGGVGYGSIGAAPAMRMAAPMVAGRPSPGGRGGRGGSSGQEASAEPSEEIREGDRKVVFCGTVTTDENGVGSVRVTLPPQTGRLVVRVIGIRSLDYATAQTAVDVKRDVAAEVRVARSFVPGARLTVPIDTSNDTKDTLTLTAEGVGVAAPFQRPVAPGHATIDLPLSLYKPGELLVTLRDGNGQTRDQRRLNLLSLSEQPVTYSRLVFGEGSKVELAAGETMRIYPGAGPLLRGVVMNIVTTTESWFGHAEALSARAAVRAVLVAAISKRLIDDEGLGHTLRTGIDKDIRDLDEAFCDKAGEGLCRPYPGIAYNPLWTGWVGRNLISTIKALEQANSADARLRQALTTAQAMLGRIRQALQQKNYKTDSEAGFDSSGQAVIPVEIDGQVVYRVLTDDAVTRWATEKLLPRLDLDAQDTEIAFSKAYDTFRFLRAFERVGGLQYLTDLATAYYQKGDLANFAKLYRQVTRGMILTQEPGLLQGPALLGGVYSTPMAMVRFLELQLLVGSRAKATEAGRAGGETLRFDQTLRGPSTVELGAGSIARIDRKDLVRMEPTPNKTWARVRASKPGVAVGEEFSLTIDLDPSRDPLEHYAIIAVPTTTSVKQTDDILSDYRGQLIYGQQGQGGTQMQIVTVPFRGKRSLSLLLEGAYRGSSPGLVMIRHIESRGQVSGVPIPELTVR